MEGGERLNASHSHCSEMQKVFFLFFVFGYTGSLLLPFVAALELSLRMASGYLHFGAQASIAVASLVCRA